MTSDISITPVGTIEVNQGRTYLSVHPEFRSALKELDGFSHINILWWGNHSDTPEKRSILIAKKPYKKGPDSIGIFATRSQMRPNPILLSCAAVIRIDHKTGRIELPWIDAENGSPVLDIKPYQPCTDRLTTVGSPEWCADWPQCYEDSGAFDWGSVFNF